jgi:hypothetical protein
MKVQILAGALTLVNLVLLATHCGRGGPLAAAEVPSVVRGRAFELVDEQGRVRATLAVMSATTHEGVAYPESVLLRLITERGRPSAKVSASEEGAALSLAGPTGTERTWVVLEAKGNASALRLRSEDGGERTIEP